MIDREKVIRGLESCLRLCDYNACRECPYGDGTPCKLLHDALALLRERGPKVKPQFDDDALDRNAYIKVGDLIDCMTELSMPEDAAFHLTGAIEWACGKRAVALPKEQEARVLGFRDLDETTTYWMEENYEASQKTTSIPETIMDIMGDRVFTIPVVKLLNGYAPVISKNREGYGKTWRAWTSRPSPEQMRDTPWEGEDDAK